VVVSFGDLELFNSGPAEVTPGPIELASKEVSVAGANCTLVNRGRRCRELTQTGQLSADNVDELRILTQHIEQEIDGQTETLVDQHETPWLQCVLITFEPGPILSEGVRYGVQYTATYRQVQP